MKQYILVFSIILILFSSCNKSGNENSIQNIKNIARPKPPKTDGPRRVLFIGNNQIDYFVSAPVLFQEFCNANNQPINIDELTTMGVSLKKVYDTNLTEAKMKFSNIDIDGNYYDYVIIQESIPIALSNIENYKANVKMIIEKIHQNSPDVAVYIYQGISPVPYGDSNYIKYHYEMRKNDIAVMNFTKNAGLLRVGDAIKDAYEGKNGYKYLTADKDNLRYGKHTLCLINDGGFIQANLLYATIFDKKPIIPKKLILVNGTNYYATIRKQEVSKTITNPMALQEIAFNNR